jgi:hypothetical protein
MSSEVDPKNLAELTSMLRHYDPAVREQAAQSLAHFGERARSAVPTLIELLADSERGVRASAGRALCKIRVDDKSVPALIEGLQSSDRDMRFWSARALATAATSPIPALPALLESLREEDDGVIRDSIRWALKAIGPASVGPLADMLRSEQPQLRVQAAGALAGGCPHVPVWPFSPCSTPLPTPMRKFGSSQLSRLVSSAKTIGIALRRWVPHGSMSPVHWVDVCRMPTLACVNELLGH